MFKKKLKLWENFVLVKYGYTVFLRISCRINGAFSDKIKSFNLRITKIYAKASHLLKTQMWLFPGSVILNGFQNYFSELTNIEVHINSYPLKRYIRYYTEKNMYLGLAQEQFKFVKKF